MEIVSRSFRLTALLVLLSGAAGAERVSLDFRNAAGGTPVRRDRSATAAVEDGEALGAYFVPAAANPAAGIAPLGVGDILDLRLMDDTPLAVEIVEETPSMPGSGSRSFLARIVGSGDLRSVAVVQSGDGLQMDVQDLAGGRVYSVFSTLQGVRVTEWNPNGGERRCQTAVPDIPPEAAEGAPTAEADVSPNMVAAAVTYVDVMVAYDTDAVSWLSGQGTTKDGFAAVAVQKMNEALANNGLDSSFRFRLVGTMETGSSAFGSLDGALYAASGRSVTVNGTSLSWPSVKTRRNELGADVVCVLVDTGSSYGTTGLGYSMTSSTRSSFSDLTFNACAIRSVASSHTMTHEVGHNMGAGHSDMVADTGNRGPQLFSYSFGYYYTANGTGYHTIMAYNTDGYGNYYTQAPLFSQPGY